MRVLVLGLAILAALPLVACAGAGSSGSSGSPNSEAESSAASSSASSGTTQASTGEGGSVSEETPDEATSAGGQAAGTSQEAVDLGRRFVEAANRGDAEAVAATFAPEARFDSIGRIYEGREEIMEDFLVPEVIELDGRYEILEVRREPEGAATFEFDFRAGSLREHFTYRIVARDGLIQDVVGRYV